MARGPRRHNQEAHGGGWVMNHADLVTRAERWLRKSMGCSVVLTELVTSSSTGETPDCIGFRGGGVSVLVECKTSRADFLSDAKKPFRLHPESGMGDFRFFMCLPGVLRQDDMPDGWGLLWVHEKHVQQVCGANIRKYEAAPFVGNKRNELVMCMSALRRAGHKIVRKACHPDTKQESHQ